MTRNSGSMLADLRMKDIYDVFDMQDILAGNVVVQRKGVMSAIAKENPQAVHFAGTELFNRLSALPARPRVSSVGAVATAMKKSVRRFHAAGSEAEVAALRLIAQEVVTFTSASWISFLFRRNR